MKTHVIQSSIALLGGLLIAGCTQGTDGGSSGSRGSGKTGSKPASTSGGLDLMQPASLNETAPETFKVRMQTTKGPIVMTVHRAWAPRGADRFYNLVKAGFYDGVAFFRVIKGFMAQTGIHGDPKVAARWSDASIQDDPVQESNTQGMVTFATSGPNSRTTQFFINFGDNSRLDRMGFAPFAKIENMDAADKLHSGYGEGAPRGRGPSQPRIRREGNTYLRQNFERLDYIEKATVQ